MYEKEENDILTIDDVCEILMIGKNSVYHLLNTHEISAFKIGRNWKIPRDAVTRYILQKSGLII